MKKPFLSALFLTISTSVLVLVPAKLCAQEAYSPPVGYVKQTVPAQSDAFIAAPLNRSPEFEGVIQSISGSMITVMGSPAWPDDKFVYNPPATADNYYLLLAGGAKEGMSCRITDSGASSVTVELQAGDDFTGVRTEEVDGAGNGDRIRIVPYWTPTTVFSEPPPNNTQLLLYDGVTSGVNLGPSEILVIYEGTWYDSGFQPANDYMIHPSEAFVVRNNSATEIGMIVVGSVPLAAHRSKILTLSAGVAQDNQVGYFSPVPETIGDCSLGFENSDQLLVLSNTQVGKNKGPQEILTYYTGKWYNSMFQDVTGTFQLQPGQGYIYRKTATTSPQAFLWQDTQSYNE